MAKRRENGQWVDSIGFNRRDFIKISGLSTAALSLGIIPGCEEKLTVVNPVKYVPSNANGLNLNPFIFINSDGKVTLVSHRPDSGNGTFMAMAMLLAEELEADIDEVEVIPASANSELYGSQSTTSSKAVRRSWFSSRQIGAAAREMLITSAAQTWGVSIEECYALKGKVIHGPTQKEAHYGELVEIAKDLDPPENPALKSTEDFRIIGQSPKRIDIPSKINGSAIYGLDLRIDHMLYASIERSPVFHGKVKSFNADEVLSVPGVKNVVQTEMLVLKKVREGVAVVADNIWSALKGREVLKIEWENGDAESWNSSRVIEQYRKDAGSAGENYFKIGDFQKAFNSAKIKIEEEYQSPMLAHAAMEPLNVIADVQEDSCKVWGPIQTPNGVRQDLATFLDLPLENIQVHPTVIGGGFGRKAYTDFANEAAYLSRKIKSPVKIIWTREDDMTQGPFRPPSINLLKGGLNNAGSVVAFSHKVSTTDYYINMGFENKYIMDGIHHAYEFANVSHDAVDSQVPIPYLWMRSVRSCMSGFAQESFIDEMAHAAGKDPMEFRLLYLKKAPRFIDVLNRLYELTNWGTSKGPGRGRGISIMTLRDSIIGQAAELSRNKEGKVRISKITAVVDCGVVINPDSAKQQIEGAIVMGLSSAFQTEITIENGKAVQNNYNSFIICRYSECPEIKVELISSKEDPGGLGEVGMPGAAPAVANALFDLTGKRIRKLPFDLTTA